MLNHCQSGTPYLDGKTMLSEIYEHVVGFASGYVEIRALKIHVVALFRFSIGFKEN